MFLIYLKTNVDEDSRKPVDLIRTESCFIDDIIETVDDVINNAYVTSIMLKLNYGTY